MKDSVSHGLMIWVVVISLILGGCSLARPSPATPPPAPSPAALESPTPSIGGLPSDFKIASVERRVILDVAGTQAAPRPGNVFLLVGLADIPGLTLDNFSLMTDMVLTDDNSHRYSVLGLSSGKFIFEVPETVNDLTLVVKDNVSVPVPW